MKASSQWLSTTGSCFSAGNQPKKYAQLSNYTAEYCEWGDGPPLVLIPGLAGGFELLGPLAKLLSKQFRVISYQLRGEDNCFVIRRPFELNDMVSDLAEFIEGRGLERPTVFGVSFGGVLALEYAHRYPNALNQLIVQGTGARFEQGLIQQVASTVLSRFPLPADNAFVNQFFNLLFGGRRRKDSLFNFVTRQCWQTDQSVMAQRFQMVQNFDMTGKLSSIRVPTLILAGDRDILVTPQSLMELCDGIEQADFVRLPNCGHLAFVTEPSLVAAKVNAFMQEQ
jgi:pimeloyl-ACP methyl ester carboxylesterase